ncbi:hypothetical protein BFW38_10685 [Terasakiispira papahanaumokuakeensis]|uniref:Uncharacterized protein n=1 Tax=Terasakiispira papahanaumokuakeensis TaxID=197479 RepID=A0A1E2VBA7_9GAMM|nr:hypothetical protein [Terasakiispira papahanaumokuakeensis]ODC03935.1 hypothetical protein BFW38_10685 [Terasakiispira papahanaumokuakeensis]
MKFTDVVVNRAERFSIGIEEDSGRFYLSIPVRNEYADYEEYYEITKEAYELYKKDLNNALEFVDKCRSRQVDGLLIQKPGRLRGTPL